MKYLYAIKTELSVDENGHYFYDPLLMKYNIKQHATHTIKVILKEVENFNNYSVDDPVYCSQKYKKDYRIIKRCRNESEYKMTLDLLGINEDEIEDFYKQ